jgi:hypothetical protein
MPPELYTCPCRFYRGAPYSPSRKTFFWNAGNERFPLMKDELLSGSSILGFLEQLPDSGKRFAEPIEESQCVRANRSAR